MSNEKLEIWVKQKLDQGIEPERVRKVLRETGRDPGVVDQVLNPFETEKKKVEEQGKKDSEKNSKQEEKNKKKKSRIKSLKKKVRKPEISRPSIPAPEISKKDIPRPDIPIKPLAGILMLLIATGVFTAADISIENPFTTHWDEPRDCDEIESSVLIADVEATEDGVTAETIVTRTAEDVVLEIFDEGERTGYTLESFEGRKEIEVDASGDTAVFRPTGCDNRAVADI